MSKTTDDLIASLAADAPAVPPGAVGRRVALGLGAGSAVSLVLMWLWFGPRPDIAEAASTAMFWMKLAYAAATGLIAALVLTRLARPGARAGALALLSVAPFAVVAVMAIVRMAEAPPEAHRLMLMGHSAVLCLWRIVVIGLPLLVGAVWAVRGLAPTRLGLAGLAAGGAAGGLGAAIYAIACNETSAPFLAIWYTLGMGLVTALGALSGSRLLRWR